MDSQFHKHFLLKFNKALIFSVLLGHVVVDSSGNGHLINHNPHHHREELDPDGKYRLEWLTDWTEKSITFNVTAETRGWIGFGLSSKGEISSADIVIGGVRPNGETHFSDRHGVAGNGRNRFPEVDDDGGQDWKLLGAWENDTHTFLSFSRPFDTCDPQDYPITEDKISLIWGFGEDDELLEGRHRHQHYQTWGKYNVYLLTPDYTPPVERDENSGAIKRILLGVPELEENFETWTISTKLEIPSRDTTYWCTVHTPPKLDKKHHIIGVETRFPSEESRQFVHHITLRKCHVPPELDPSALYEPFVNSSGDVCNVQRFGGSAISTKYCTEWSWVWTVGGKAFFFPPQFGIPIGGGGGGGTPPNEFFVAQVHYNNPAMSSNITVEANIDFFYTSNLRPKDAGILLVGAQVPGLPPTILIPPKSVNHHVYVHCSPECTREMFPPESGITISAGLLHAHNSAVGLRLQHFRNEQELPWILADTNYDNSFQQWRVLGEEVRVLPGDQLTLECTYDNSWTNSSVVGGLSTREEMCTAFLLYYAKLGDYGNCIGEMKDEESMETFLGVNNISWSPSHLQYVVVPPHPLAGSPMTQVSDSVDWTREKREELQRFHLTHPQVNLCPKFVPDRRNGSGSSSLHLAKYPLKATSYKPQMNCPGQG